MSTLRGTAPPYPLNPAYGSGLFRRRIRLEGRAGQVFGALEDTNHGFCVTVHHDGCVVTAIAPEAKRVPFTTCPQAGENLRALLGCRIDTSARELNLQAGPSTNCTHLLDLTILAIRHAARGETTCQWDVTVTDEPEGSEAVITVERNGERIDQWKARQFHITEPAALAGKPLYLGFARWANEHFGQDRMEAAFIMQKAYFVSQARRYDLSTMTGERALATRDSMGGACYTYSPPAIETAVRTANTVRDFSGHPERLLRFE